MMNLETDEVILRIIRKHPFYLILSTFGIIILALIPELLIFFLNMFLMAVNINVINILNSFVSIELQGFLYSLWLLFLWFIFIAEFSDFYLDKWVITNKRIIDINQQGFFSRETSSARYDKIQDVTVEVSGFIPTILNFGTIIVQTAGVDQEFKLTLAPNPLLNKEFIIDQKQSHSSRV